MSAALVLLCVGVGLVSAGVVALGSIAAFAIPSRRKPAVARQEREPALEAVAQA